MNYLLHNIMTEPNLMTINDQDYIPQTAEMAELSLITHGDNLPNQTTTYKVPTEEEELAQTLAFEKEISKRSAKEKEDNLKKFNKHKAANLKRWADHIMGSNK
jgi:hypothetical protein